MRSLLPVTLLLAGCGAEPAARPTRPGYVVVPPLTDARARARPTREAPAPRATRAPRQAAPREAAAPAVSAEGASEVGQATWYGEELQGRRTASGEPFDLNLLTAAHKSLPFGTRVRVTHLKSGQSVEVRINDRNGGREVIDLSKAAAAKIGLVREGRAQVRLDVL